MSRNSARLGTVAATWTCPAEPVVSFEQGDPVTPFGCGHRCLQPAGATADHHHRRAGAVAAEGRLRLAPGPRVLDAAQPAVEPHAAHALLVAGQAGADVGGVPRPGLGREVRVGDLAPHHPDQVAEPVAEGPVGLERVLEPAHADHRHASPPGGWRSG